MLLVVEKLDRIFMVLGMMLGFIIAPQFVIKVVAAEFSQLSIGGIVYALIVWGLIIVFCGFVSGCVGSKLKKLVITWNDPEA
jgi:hypothetical protein